MMNSRSLHFGLVWGLRVGTGVFGWEEGRTADPSASLGMTKGRVALSLKFVPADDEQQVPPLRFAPVGVTLLFES